MENKAPVGVCSAGETCLKNCECQYPHPISGPCTRFVRDGVCFHDDHIDSQPRKGRHVVCRP